MGVSGIWHLAAHLAAECWRLRHSTSGPASKTRGSERQGIVVGRDAPCLESVCHCFAAATLGLGSLVPWFLGPISSGILRPVTACSRHGPVLTQANPLKPPIRSSHPSTVRPASPSSQRPSGHQRSSIVCPASRIPPNLTFHLASLLPSASPRAFFLSFCIPSTGCRLSLFLRRARAQPAPATGEEAKHCSSSPTLLSLLHPPTPRRCRPLARLAESLCSSPPHQKKPQRVYHLGVSAASASCAM